MTRLNPPIPSSMIRSFVISILLAASAAAQVRNFDDNNNQFVQERLGASVRGETFNFLAGNDRLGLQRNDDLAGLGSGSANMGSGRDVVVTSFNMSGTVDLGAGNDLFVSDGDVNFNGNAVDIVVRAGPGNDIIAVDTGFCSYQGDQGNDVFLSQGGGNFFDGGPESDTYSAELAGSAATISLLEGAAETSSSPGIDSFDGVENARGSAFADVILGSDGPNRIDGLDGNDAIDARGGNDTVSGGAGTNTLAGGSGTDTLVIRGTVTSRSLSGGLLTVVGVLNGVAFRHDAREFEQVHDNGTLRTVAAFVAQNGSGTVQQTLINETQPVPVIEGLVAGQTLNGDNNPNTISGGAGFDDIAGFGGDDTLRGRAGDDHISGGNGNDTLLGESGNDSLNGGNNNDSLDGGPGKDTLTGGAGGDTFLFTAALAGNDDVVTDYNTADDSIRIARSLVGSLPAGTLAASRFKNTASGAIDGDDRIVYESSNGRLSFDSNGSASGGRVLIARLPARLAMVAGEITLQ